MSVSSKETSFGRQLPPFSFFLLLPRLSRQFQYYCCVEASHCKRDSFLISAATGTYVGWELLVAGAPNSKRISSLSQNHQHFEKTKNSTARTCDNTTISKGTFQDVISEADLLRSVGFVSYRVVSSSVLPSLFHFPWFL
jgi:hypothetical protein